MAEKTNSAGVPRLISVSYSEFEEDTTRTWQLDTFELRHINLIVGLNATGKSRLLRIINGLARMIDGSVSPVTLTTGSYKARFSVPSSTKLIDYEFSIVKNKIILERLLIENELQLDRQSSGPTRLRFEKERLSIEVQIPPILLAVTARRDAVQHPFFEPLHDWAATVKLFSFTLIEQHQFSSFEGKVDFDVMGKSPAHENFHLLMKLGKDRFGHSFTSAVLQDMRRLGYDLESFGLKPMAGIAMPIPTLFAPKGAAQTLVVREKGIETEIPQMALSSGMIRALAALVFLHTSRLLKRRDCLVIDDIGEGLDFDRSTKLIKIFIEEAQRGFLQLVMTTNDRFVMNSVPLENWSIIQREGGKVVVFNARNSPEAFEEFEQLGFSNFDFFSRKGYLGKGRAQNKK